MPKEAATIDDAWVTALDDEGRLAVDVLRDIKANGSRSQPENAPRVMHISLYCFKSFAIRGFHTLTRDCGIDVRSVFFKENLTNRHKPTTEAEIVYLLNEVREFDPQVITMSVLAPYAITAREITERIREISDAAIVLGGKFPTIDPQEALTFADYACKGEGELALIEMFRRMHDGKTGRKDFRDIRGLWFKADDGAIVDMGQQTLIEELDLIPFQSVGEPGMTFIEHDMVYDHDPETLNDEVWIMAGRGCVYVCSYCVNSLLIPMNRGNGRFVRLRSPENVVEEIEALRAKQPYANAVSFNDEVFGVFDDWTAEFSEVYKERVDLPFEAELVPRLIKEHNVEKLAYAGIESLHFGIQSGSDELRRKVLKRPGKNTELIETAEMLARHGVGRQYDIILDNPFDSPDVLEEALDLLLAMPAPMKLNTYKMQFFPFYPLTVDAIKEGFITEDDVTYEKVADGTMYNFVFKPRISTSRMDHLQAAIYLLPWQDNFIWWLARSVRRNNIPGLGYLACVLAQVRYQQDFMANPALIWVRRARIGLKMLFSGQFGAFMGRARDALRRDRTA